MTSSDIVAVRSIVALMAGLMLVGCSCKQEATTIEEIDLRSDRALAGSQDHLARAIATLERADQLDQAQARSMVISQLSQWIESQPPVADWSGDPLVQTLPAKFGVVFRYAPLKRMQFVVTDYNTLHEAVWMRQIVNYQMELMRDQNPQPFYRVEELATALRKLQRESDEIQSELQGATNAADKPALEEASSANEQRQTKTAADLAQAQNELDLAKCAWLFDWTTRNIRLKETHWDSTLPEAGGETPEKLIAPPPGAEYMVWQSLLLGEGDAVQRGRIFLLLCRQAKIDVVMLGLESDEPNLAPREWAAAAIIGDELYLFDAELGVPIPGRDGKSHATLAEVRAHPELLRKLDTEEFACHVQAEDLDRLVPLIDASLEALSQRMMLVEQSLPQTQKMVLTTTPSVIARRLRKHDLAGAQVWQAPYRGYLYGDIRRMYAVESEDYYLNMAALNPPLELYTGRLHHFRGEIEEPTDEELFGTAIDPNSSLVRTSGPKYEHGAKYYYLECRSPKGEIDAIQQDLEAWFNQDRTRTRQERLIQLAEDLYALEVYKQRRSALQSGDIDPAEQFYRQQLEAEAMEKDPDAAAELRRGQRELLPEELEHLRQIEERLKVLSPTTREWIERLGRLQQNVVALQDEDRGDFIAQFKRIATRAKEHATWWLAMVMMESREFGVAANFLQRPADAADGVWGEDAHYALGRLYEMAGQREKAIEHYQADQSPQRAGSLLRAKWLAESATPQSGT